MGVERDKTIDELLQGSRGVTIVATGRSPSSGCRVPATSALLTRWLSRLLLSSSVTLTRPFGLCRPATRTESRTVMRWVPCASPSGLALCSIPVERWRSAAAGSLERERLLESQPEDIVERGYFLIHEFFQHLGRGDSARAEETAARAVQIGSPLLRPRPDRSGVELPGPGHDLLRPYLGRAGIAR